MPLRLFREDGEHLIMLGVVGLATYLFAFTQIHLISLDGAFSYIPVARLFSEGRYIEALQQPRLPLFPLLISLLSHLTGSLELAGKIISMTFSLLAIVPLYCIVRYVVNSQVAFWATLFYLVNPLMVQCSVDVLTEGQIVFFFLASVYCSLRFIEQKSWNWLLFTLIFVLLGAMTKLTTLIIPIVMIIWLGYKGARTMVRDKNPKDLIILCEIVGGIIVLILIGMWFWKARDPFEIVQNLFIRWIGRETPGFSHVLHTWGIIVGRFVDAGHPLLLLFMLLGLILRIRQKKISPSEWYIGLLVLTTFIFFFLNLYAVGRYFLPIIALLYLWAGYGFEEARDYLRLRFKNFPKLASCLPVIVVLVILLPAAFAPQRLNKIGRKEVGRWLKAEGSSSPIIMTNIPRVAYYAGGDFILLSPDEHSEEIIQRAQKERPDYVVIEREEEGFAQSMGPYEKAGTLELVLRYPYGKCKVIYVYKWRT